MWLSRRGLVGLLEARSSSAAGLHWKRGEQQQRAGKRCHCQWLADAGFVDIKEEAIRLPLSGWPAEAPGQDLGWWFNLGVQRACQPLSSAPLIRGHSWALDEIPGLWLARDPRNMVPYSVALRARILLLLRHPSGTRYPLGRPRTRIRPDHAAGHHRRLRARQPGPVPDAVEKTDGPAIAAEGRIKTRS
ncbi:predicted protein [Chaetomium globosum CBS 148.51]|uniref:Uncharacterized protein n=1 Tax=Chaetomium globosum (strain ATCC 6205 / CBS 148.51 / DSM 1962 / NBRC 6347 / NRRL 1970) TaxID=306901 RepID=Q2GYP1_CHAGB|nr:uncharacterized protein CHGG_06913 [Chaetomium globosum CBS 148.51]EAQ85660.1 predicted protein [Chaetomium globosum CBS 148.51]